MLAIASVALASMAIGCAVEEPPASAPIGVKASALSNCSSESQSPFQQTEALQVIVRHTSGYEDGQGEESYNQSFDFSGSSSVRVEDVPEGPDEEVTVYGWAAGQPAWFGRQKHVVVGAGRDNGIQMVLSRYGGFSCPAGDNEYTHRLFSSVTSLGGGLFFIAGGLTQVESAGVTKFTASDASRKAFLYNSRTGQISRVASLMQTARGAHSAVLVEGPTKNWVLLFGGTSAMTYNPAEANGFAWSYSTTDAHSTVDVYEYAAGGDPAEGEFLVGNTAQMFRKRVFATANVISTDGLVLVCGGGPWGLNDKPDGFTECDVWDAPEQAFLGDLSNNFMSGSGYRTAHSAVAFQEGEITKLLMVGGSTEGPVGEIYTSSGAQRDGVGGAFLSMDIAGAPHSFFQTLTPIGNREFMMVGGVNWNGLNFESPDPNNAWLLRVVDDGNGGYTVQSEQQPGLGVGRYFHSAAAPAGNRYVVLGGFTNNNLSATADIRFLERGVGLIPPPETEGAFLARGGMTTMLLDNDTLLLAGGITSAADLENAALGALEVYTPSNLSGQ